VYYIALTVEVGEGKLATPEAWLFKVAIF